MSSARSFAESAARRCAVVTLGAAVLLLPTAVGPTVAAAADPANYDVVVECSPFDRGSDRTSCSVQVAVTAADAQVSTFEHSGRPCAAVVGGTAVNRGPRGLQWTGNSGTVVFRGPVRAGAPNQNWTIRTRSGSVPRQDTAFDCSNQTPIAHTDVASVEATRTIAIDVLANDVDPDGDPLTITGLTQPSSGTVRQTGATQLEYTAAALFRGIAQFSYNVSDDRGGSTQAAVTVTVTNLPPPSYFWSDSLHCPGQAQCLSTFSIGATDGEGEFQRVQLLSDPNFPTTVALGPHGGRILTDASRNHLAYAPSSSCFVGTEELTFNVVDASDAVTSSRAVISMSNTRPLSVISGYVQFVDESSFVVIDPFPLGADTDGDSIAVSLALPSTSLLGTARVVFDSTLFPARQVVHYFPPFFPVEGVDEFEIVGTDGCLEDRVPVRLIVDTVPAPS